MNLAIENKILFDVQKSLTAYLPNGQLWEACNVPGTNLNALLAGLSGTLLDVGEFYRVYNSEFIPTQEGTAFLVNWERAVGIPDDCFSGQGSIDERRRDVIVKLSALGVQTLDDFVRLGQIFGVSITITHGATINGFTYKFPIRFFRNKADSIFTIIVTFDLFQDNFPWIFPVVFGDSDFEVLKCLINKLVPVNVGVIYPQEEV